MKFMKDNGEYTHLIDKNVNSFLILFFLQDTNIQIFNRCGEFTTQIEI